MDGKASAPRGAGTLDHGPGFARRLKAQWIGAEDRATPRKGIGYHAAEARQGLDEVKWVQADLGRVVPIDRVVLYPSAGTRGSRSSGLPGPLQDRGGPISPSSSSRR